MAYKMDEETKEDIKLEKTEIVLNCDQTRKRRSSDISSCGVPKIYIRYKIRKEVKRISSNSSQDKINKKNHELPSLPILLSNEESPIERTEIRKVKDEAEFDRATMFATVNSIPIFYQDAQMSIPIPASLCTMTSIFQDIDDHFNFLTHMRERENQIRPNPFHLNEQLEIDDFARALLINWLVSVANEFNFELETLYLTVAYIDQFLSRIIISRNGLLLMGVTAIFIASKYEETSPPSITNFTFVGGINFDINEILKMERFILKTLSYDLHIPTLYTFTSAFALLTNLPHLPTYLALYLCELSLLDTDPYLQYLPSEISAGSHALARYILGYSIWSRELEQITLYRLEDLKSIIILLCESHIRAKKYMFSSTKMKFMEERYHQVALIAPLNMDEFLFDRIVENYYLIE